MKKILLCVMSSAAVSGAAADEVGRWYVMPAVGMLYTDNDRDVEHRDALYGLSIGKHLSDRWSLELNANRANAEGFEPEALSLDALRVFRRDQLLSPYVTFGAGALRDKADTASGNTDLIAQAGAGLLWQLGETRRRSGAFSLRPEIKARWNDDGSYVDYMVMLGAQFSFGSAQAIAAPEPASPPPQPEPAAPEPVAAAPADTDGDGVPDANDRCPGTSRGVAVDGSGCPQLGSITLAGVNFETDSATLTSASLPLLDRLAADLRKHPRFEIELQGHTDSTGPEQYNLHLSQQRADAVREYLLSQGVGASQIVSRGYGESRPVGDNGTTEGRAQNRRVVMEVLQNPGNLKIEGEDGLGEGESHW